MRKNKLLVLCLIILSLSVTGNPNPVLGNARAQPANSAQYELFIEIDYMPDHRPNQAVLDYIEEYYLERGISITFILDDTVSDPTPEDWITMDDFWQIESEHNDVIHYNDWVPEDPGLSHFDKYRSKEKWVLYGTRYIEKQLSGFSMVWRRVRGPFGVLGQAVAGNWIFIADWLNDKWAELEGIEERGVEACALMHELGHAIGIGVFTRTGWAEWEEDYDDDSGSVMAERSHDNTGNYDNWYYSDEYWEMKDLRYYIKPPEEGKLQLRLESELSDVPDLEVSFPDGSTASGDVMYVEKGGQLLFKLVSLKVHYGIDAFSHVFLYKEGKRFRLHIPEHYREVYDGRYRTTTENMIELSIREISHRKIVLYYEGMTSEGNYIQKRTYEMYSNGEMHVLNEITATTTIHTDDYAHDAGGISFYTPPDPPETRVHISSEGSETEYLGSDMVGLGFDLKVDISMPGGSWVAISDGSETGAFPSETFGVIIKDSTGVDTSGNPSPLSLILYEMHGWESFGVALTRKGLRTWTYYPLYPGVYSADFVLVLYPESGDEGIDKVRTRAEEIFND